MPAPDAARVVELLCALGPAPRSSKDDVKTVCFAWKVAVMRGGQARPRSELQAELRGACTRFILCSFGFRVCLISGVLCSERFTASFN